MPGMRNKEKLAGATTRRNCIHCHMIHDAENMAAQASGKYSQEMLWRYPLPNSLGIELDAKDGTKISSITKDSPAERAGLKSGQRITRVNRQAITSIADVQWVLHHLSNDGAVVSIETDQRLSKVKVSQGWKRSDISWRGSLWSIAPKLRVWTPPVSESDRRKYSIPKDQAPLIVRWINTGSAGGRSARDSGLRKGDLIVGLEGKPMKMTPQYFNLHIKLNYKVGDELPITVLRNGERRDLKIKLVE